MEYSTWEVWETLIHSKLMSSKVRRTIDHKVGQQKFYSLRETAEGLTFQAPDGLSPTGMDQVYYLRTAEYMRGWMYVFTQKRKLQQEGEGGSSLSPRDFQNLLSLQYKYPVVATHVEHPELFTWYEVAVSTISGLMPMGTVMDVFEYHGPTPQILREIPLATFSMQMAELLH